MGMKIEGLNEARRKFNAFPKEIEDAMTYWCRQKAGALLDLSVDHTPVDTGALRRMWQATLPQIQYGRRVSIRVFNNMEYAPYVEYGHRNIRNKKYVGYTPGRYFFRKTLNEFKSISKQMNDDAAKDLKRRWDNL